MGRAIEQLLAEYKACLSWETEQRRSWLDGLDTVEGANLFSMIHNSTPTLPAEVEAYPVLEALNWVDYHEKMERLARQMGVQLSENDLS
ncbi:MAG: hypothetical protein CVU38_16025 [Chloroflexi bacterium HGW-Chloroflexi-1]|nr:MAG: hypothetical protein CVU38_16025 [Chloroflexi bacterium HGW-Chloroflexi-1]